MPDSMTQVQRAGPPGTKVNLAVLGDGFAEGDQELFDAKVAELLLDGVFGHDYFHEDAAAFNLYRVNLVSAESGVTRRCHPQDGGAEAGTDWRDTALGYVYNGSWEHHWVEPGPGTAAALRAALDRWVPDHQLVLVLLNEPAFGGFGGGGLLVATLGVDWTLVAHELGHALGGLADEYCQSRPWPGGEPGAVNLTANPNRATLKWAGLVAPSTPIPSGIGTCAGFNQGAPPAGWDQTQDVGLFEGGGAHGMGVFRPVVNCRMRGIAPPFCPVCHGELKRRHHRRTGQGFARCHTGDLDGDGRAELLLQSDSSLLLYRSNGTELELYASLVDRVPGSWRLAAGDRLLLGDLDGDGADEVLVYNPSDWARPYLGLLADDGRDGLELVARWDGELPGWPLAPNDRFHLADLDGDGAKDLVVLNGADHGAPRLALLRSQLGSAPGGLPGGGRGLEPIARFQSALPGWQLGRGDRLLVGDFDGDGREDLWLANGGDWALPYLALLRSTGDGLALASRYDGALPGWRMRPGDRYLVGDFDGDGRADLYAFNGRDWSVPYLLMAASTGSGLDFIERYEGNVPGWQMRAGDRHWLADLNGDGRADLFVANSSDWAGEYLGTMVSNGKGLSAEWRRDFVGDWNLGPDDRFLPCNYQGGQGTPDLIVSNGEWLGMIRATPALVCDRVYHRWIRNPRYGRPW